MWQWMTSAEPPDNRSRTHTAVSPAGMPCRLSHLSKPSRTFAKRRPSGSSPALVPTQWIVAWACFGHYTALARAWKGKLSDKLDLKVHVKQYNLPADDNPVPGYCNVLCLILFERQPTVGGFKRPRSSGSTVG